MWSASQISRMPLTDINFESSDIEQNPTSMFYSRCGDVLKSTQGVVMGLLAAVLLAISYYLDELIQKEGGITPFQATFFVNIGASISVIPFIIYKSINVLGDSIEERVVLTAIGTLYLGAICALNYAVVLGPMGNVTGIFRGSMPIFTPIIALVIIKESFHIINAVAIVINTVAILLLAQPSVIFGDGDQSEQVKSHEIYAYSLSLCVGFQLSLSCVSVRYLGERTHILTILLYISIIGFALSLIFTLVAENAKWAMTMEIALKTIGMVVTNVLGDACRFRALQLIEATTVVLLANFQIFVALLLQAYILCEVPNIYSILGGCLVFLGSTICAVTAWWKKYQQMARAETTQLGSSRVSDSGGSAEYLSINRN
ncbi:solute carrier family 35 member G1-like [Saccoglossus kowalevskii]